MRLPTVRLSFRVPAALVAGILAGTILVSPALGHIGSVSHLWSKHILPKADARYERPLYAVVNGTAATPDLISGRGAISVERITSGDFRVTFSRRVDFCTPIVQPGGYPHASSSFQVGAAGVGHASVQGLDAPWNRQVRVVVRNLAGTAVNSHFHLTVTC